MPTIEAYGRPIKTVFGLLGHGENALSAALCYCMSRDTEFLREVLRLAGVARLREGDLQAARIRVQRHRDEGITDVEVLLRDKVHVIFEAKIGLNVPSEEQIQRYLKALAASPAEHARLVVILAVDTEMPLRRLQALSTGTRVTVGAILWANLGRIAHALARHATELSHVELRDFARFLEEEYYMRAYTDEVWIVPANTTPLWPGGLSFVDTHLKGRIYYRTDRAAVRPLYIALRFDGQVRTVQKVLGVDHNRPPIDYVPELRHVAETWPREPHVIWRLGEPVPLPRPIPTGDPKMQARMVSCDFVDLLTRKTVREIEKNRSRSGGGPSSPSAGGGELDIK